MNQFAITMDITHASGTPMVATPAISTGPRSHGRVDSAGLGATSALGTA